MYIEKPTIKTILEHVRQLHVQPNETICFLFGEQTIIDYHDLIAQLNKAKLDFLGAFFPGIIFGNKSYKEGVIIHKYETHGVNYVIPNMDGAHNNLLLTQISQTLPTNTSTTALVLLDGLSPNIAPFMNEMYNTIGNLVNYIGAGAGASSFKAQPCIISPKGLLQNAAIISFIKTPMRVSVKHGWEKLEGPVLATKTEKNIIYELNWQKAFDVYQEIINKDSPLPIAKENFFDIAQGYPFGINIEGRENIVRDPLSVGEAGEITCIGEVNNNTVLNILTGTANKLINSVAEAAKEVIDPIQNIDSILVIDCISRVLYLQEDFDRELNAISQYISDATIPILGVLSLGEIASEGNNPLYLHNKTIVIGGFGE